MWAFVHVLQSVEMSLDSVASTHNTVSINPFLRATAVPAGTAEARICYGDSVRLSVRLSRPGAETTE